MTSPGCSRGPTAGLWAVNPESGYFGVIPGTNARTNPNAMATIAHDTIYTNVATLDDGTVWWEGKDGPPPAVCTDWQGQRWTPNLGTPAAHPNSRFTSPMRNNPALAPEAEEGGGVPISAIIFGGRRVDTVPLVLPVARLDPWRVPRGDNGQRNHRCRRRCRRAGAA